MFLDAPAILGDGNARLVDEQTFAYAGTTSNISVDISGMEIEAGDFVVCIFGYNGGGGTTYNISGFTQVCNLYQSAAEASNLKIGYKVMSPVDSSITITGGTGLSGAAGAAIVQSWRKIAAYESAATATDSLTILADPPALNVSHGHIIIVAVLGAHKRGSSATFDSADLSLTQIVSDDVKDCTLAAGHIVSDGSEFDPAQYTFNSSDSTNHSWCACTFSLEV